MKKSDIDWPYMRQGIVPIAIASAVTVLLMIATVMMKSNARETLEHNQALLADFQQQGNEMRGRLDALERYGSAFEQLARTGVIGTEERLIWVQYFRDTANRLGLPYMRYTADQQQVFSAPWLPVGNTAPVLVSKLKLQIGLIHSLDLLRIVDNLRDAPGFFHVSGCDLERVVKDGSIYANKPNILANCDLDWFSIPASGKAAI